VAGALIYTGSLKASETLQLNIKTIPGIERHLLLFPHPAHLMLVARNASNPLVSGSIEIINKHSFKLHRRSSWPIGDITVEFFKKESPFFWYRIGMDFEIADVHKLLKFVVKVDTSLIFRGTISVQASTALLPSIPLAIIDRAEFILNKRLSLAKQKPILAYLDKLPPQSPLLRNVDMELALILKGAYNRVSRTQANKNQSSSLFVGKPELELMIVFVFWFVVFVMGYVLYRFAGHLRAQQS